MNTKDTIIINFYRFILVPIALTVAVFLLAPWTPKLRRFFGLKFRPRNRFFKHAIWFHSASGEFEYCKPLIRTLTKVSPETGIFCSYTSDSYQSRVENFKGVDGSGPLPLDLLGPVSQFLKDLQPKKLLIAKTDLWPELIWQCWQKKIPVVVFAVVAKTPGFAARFFGFIKRWMYNKCDKVLCMTENDAQNLRLLGVTTPIEVTGDPRIDQIMDRVNSPDKQIPQTLHCSDPVFLAGSTWPVDEDVILGPVLEAMKAGKCRFIIAPHEPSEKHQEALRKQCESLGLELVPYSQLTTWTSHQVVYVDVIGVLADLYSVSQMAFIGGSFKSQVHSVGEAIGHGNFVLVGPKNNNNREAQIFKTISVGEASIVTEISNPSDLIKNLDRLTQSALPFDQQKQQIKEQMQKLSGGTAKTLKALDLG